MTSKNCQKCLKGLDALVNLGIFICICILCSLSSKEPFKSHIIGDINNYFYGVTDINNENQCSCNNITLNHSCTQEELNQGCEDISLDKYYSFRKLESDSFCMDMYASFVRNKGKKMSYIFDLKYKRIRNFSIVVMILSISFFVIAIPAYICAKKNKTSCLLAAGILLLLAWLARIVLSILLFYYIENGDIQKYDDFLDCKNIKKNYFDKFSDVSKLRKCFLAFGIFSIISEIIGKLENLFESPDE